MRIAAAVFLMVTLLAVVAHADDGAVRGAGGAIRAMEEHPTVAMETMAVAIRLNPDREARVECHFLFRNTGPATTVRMGFPESASGEGTDVRHPRGFTNFTTWVEGKRVPAKIEGFEAHREVSHWSRWRVKRVHFAAGQTRRVRVQYTAPLGEISDGSRFLEYRIGTGGSWKGPIGYARVRVYPEYRPEKWRLGTGEKYWPLAETPFTWESNAFEPEANESINLIFEPVRSGASEGELRGKLIAAFGETDAGLFYEALYRFDREMRPPDRTQYSWRALRYVQKHDLPAPWLAVGDFNGDGAKDAAVRLVRGQHQAFVVVHSTADGRFRVHILTESEGRVRHDLETVLQARAPGPVAYWQEGETTPKSGRLELKHDGIEVVDLGKGAVLYYWDEGKQWYSTVQTAD